MRLLGATGTDHVFGAVNDYLVPASGGHVRWWFKFVAQPLNLEISYCYTVKFTV